MSAADNKAGMMPDGRLRGYFGLGVEGISKPVNLGSVLRVANAFGASFVFTLGADLPRDVRASDTADTPASVPTYGWAGANDMALPRGCRLVAVELADEAIDLPSFRHPRQAAYVLGSERYGLSPATLAAADHVVRIPMRFSVNLAVAGAIVLYDRLYSAAAGGSRRTGRTGAGPCVRPAGISRRPAWRRIGYKDGVRWTTDSVDYRLKGPRE